MRARHALIGLSGAAAVTLIAGALMVAPLAQAQQAPNYVANCATPNTPRVMHCLSLRRTDVKHSLGVMPNAVSGITPANLTSAYKLPSGGSGQTVAIVDAMDDPNAESDLQTYRSQFGLPTCTTANGCFKKVNQTGGSTPPSADTGWAGEIALDIDMVSAVCPNCHILLVEANSASDSDLYTAEDYATSHAKFVSNSWGGAEDSSQTSNDSHFNKPGVAITVSSGDSDYGAEYPATSQYVTAVGGTSLRTSSNSRGWTESVWNTTQGVEGTGSGCSAYDPKPSWQAGVSTNCSKRAEADVAADADPATGPAVYDSYGGSGWGVVGGTSAASPIVAGIWALAGAPAASDQAASYPWKHGTDGSFFDVTSGNNGTCGNILCTAGTGWDGPTGWGTPNGTAGFTAGGTGGPGPISVNNPGSQTSTVGTAASLTLSASGGTAPYTWTATGLPAGLSLNASTGVISGTPTTAGTSNVTVTAKDSTGATASASFSWTVTPTGGGCNASNLLGNPGFETGTAAPWTASSGVVDNSSGEAAHSGSWKAWLDGYGSTHSDTLSQTVTIPSSCTSASLSYWLHIDTAETGTKAYDTLTVKAGSTTLATYSNVNANTGYAQKTVSLNSFIGKSVTITFTGTEDSSLQTSFVIDDTAVSGS